MTTTSADPTLIFADARQMHDAALQRMAAGDIRDAAEKAWRSTVRAAEGLVLARTGQQPETSTLAGRRLQTLSLSDQSLRELRDRYYARQSILHGECFYHEYCPPMVIERLIYETAEFIQDAYTLANP